MKMNFYVVAKLLSATNGLLFSGYIAFILSVIAILLKGWQSLEFWIFIILSFGIMMIHHYVSLRLKFDAELIEIMAQQSDTVSIENLTQQFDQSLMQFKLIPESKAGRDWSLRFTGCYRLFKLQITLLFIQYFVLIILIYKLLTP
ncbi:hypothetical protein [Acinetobacter piscicola]|uniref:hypothetical protein n=1 Tax=Acinetobacter piscicola TaxID=2006115 RepID=UPI000B7FD529|nr:hypothetical protein [Acinetobacter piscicola]